MTAGPTIPPSARRFDRFITWSGLAGVAALAAALAWTEIFSPDIGFHLNTGRWIIEHGTFPARKLFLYSVDAPYSNSYWLYQTASWLVFNAAGTAGLVIAHFVATFAAYALVVSQIRSRTGWLPACGVPIMLLGVFGNTWELRPHTLSWIYLAALVGLMRRRESNRIWLAPVIMVLWANTHSLFVLGWAVLTAHAIDRARTERGRRDRRFWGALALSFAACLINPYGVEGVMVPFRQWQNLQAGSAFKSLEYGIHEHLSPFSLYRYSAATGDFRLFQPVLGQHLYLAVVASGLLAAWRQARLVDVLVIGLFGYVYSLGEKNAGYFFVATAPAVAGLWHHALRAKNWRGFLLTKRTILLVTGFLAFAGAWLVVNGNYYAYLKSPFRPGHRFNPDVLPVGAAEFLNRVGLPAGARLLNNLDAGGYLAFATRRDVFIDGSLESIPEPFFREYQASKDLRLLPGFLKKWRPDVVIVPFTDIPQWLSFFEKAREWRLVYVDAREAVYFRAGFEDRIQPIGPWPEGLTPSDWSDEFAREVIERHVARRQTLCDRLAIRQAYPIREIRLSAVCLATRRFEAAVAAALEGMRAATDPNPDLLLNAGHAFYALQKGDLALLCYQHALSLDRSAHRQDDPALRVARERILRLQAPKPYERN